MEKNLFTFNFDKKDIFEFLKLNRPFLVVLIVLGSFNFISLKIGYLTQDGTKQAVWCKRQWVKTDEISKESNGKNIVLFLGNSKIVAGIIPEVFDQAVSEHVFSYNLALAALPLGPNYFVLKKYLEHNPPPQYIITTLDPGGLDNWLMPYYAPINAGFFEILQYSYYGKNPNIMFNYLLPIRFYLPEIWHYFSRKISMFASESSQNQERQKYMDELKKKETFQHDLNNWYRLRYIDFEKASKEREVMLKKNRGYYYIEEQAALGGQLPDDYVSKIKKEQTVSVAPLMDAQKESQNGLLKDPFLKPFFELAKTKRIKVILISSYDIKYQHPLSSSVPEVWKWAQNNYPNVYYANFEPQFYEPKYFSDPVHLNPKGALRYTLEIADEFKSIVNK